MHRQICRHHVDADIRRANDRPARRLKISGRACDEDEVAPLGGKHLSGGAADASRPASDQHRFASQPEIHCRLRPT